MTLLFAVEFGNDNAAVAALALMCEPGVPTLTVIGHVVDLFADAALHYPASLAPGHLSVSRVAV